LDIIALNPEVTVDYTLDPPPPDHMVDGNWETDPIGVIPITPWFRAEFQESGESGTDYVATDVEIEVRDADLNLVWSSGWLNFAVYEEADDPILPNRERVLRSGHVCELPFQKDHNSQLIPTALFELPRQGESYTWRIRFFVDSIATATDWVDGVFSMFEEVYSVTSLRCEGLINPSDVIDLTPEFDGIYEAIYTDWYEPSCIGVQIQVASVDTFLSGMMWDSGWIIVDPPLYPGVSGISLLQMIYEGLTLRRNGVTYYWRLRLRIDAEWGTAYSDWQPTQYFEMFDEVCSAADLRVDSLVAPLTLKNYHPVFTAVFSNNYSLARATHMQLQVCSSSWVVKWDTGWIDVDLAPSEECSPLPYPSPYPVGDTGFFFDNTAYKFKIRFQYESDGSYTTSYTESLFTMGEATVEALFPKIDGATGNRNVLSFTPMFSADYTTDAYDSVEKDREYCKEVWIQVFSDSGLSVLVWDSSWVPSGDILDDNPTGGVECTPVRIPNDLLVEYTRYWWRIRFKNEKGIIGGWSEVWWFDCIGYIISDVAQTDVINGYWEGKEYEFRVVSRDSFIGFYLKNLTDDSVIYNNVGLNKGGQPRILFNSSTGMITLMFISNGKLFSREWLITDLPEVAPLTAPQLVDGTLEAFKVLPLNYDLVDLGTRPLPPTNPFLYLGSVCDEDGNLYPSFNYVVIYTSPLTHPYFEEGNNIKVYVDNGVLESEQVVDPFLPFVPASMLGVDILNEQVSKVAPWLPDKVADEIESVKTRALYLPTNKASVILNKLESSIGNEVLLQDSVYSTIQIWKYKESVRVSDDIIPPIMDSDPLALNSIYLLDQVWVYKEAAHISEDIISPLMGRESESPGVVREDVIGDYIYGQNYTVYKYYSANIR
jgi:hypothetical protein